MDTYRKNGAHVRRSTNSQGRHTAEFNDAVNQQSWNADDQAQGYSQYDDSPSNRGQFQSSASDPGRYEADWYDDNSYSATPSPADLRIARTSGSDPDNEYSRANMGSRYSAKNRKKSKKPLIVAIIIIVVLVAGVGTAAGLTWWNSYKDDINSSLHAGVTDDLKDALGEDTVYTGAPFYMLLMGVDGSAEREASEEYAGDNFRSDSMMLVRLDPANKKVTMVSLHRDTLVDLGEYGKQKLNAAHSLGGSALAVTTVEDLAGVDISHYAEINFDGFKEIVDALGGVEVDAPMTIDDEEAGGHVDAGLQTLNGEQALILCRARHAYDDYGDGDLYRAANQRLVLSAIAKKVLNSDVATMTSVIKSLAGYVTTDFDVDQIINIATAMRGLDPDADIYTGMEPTTSQYINGGWYEYLDTDAWKKMMQRVDQGLPPNETSVVDSANNTVLATTGNGTSSTSSSSTTTTTTTSDTSSTNGADANNCDKTLTITVKNGSDINGIGATVVTKLSQLGLSGDASNANSSFDNSVIVYNEDSEKATALEIAKLLGMSSSKVEANNNNYAFDGNIMVLVGSDWNSVSSVSAS